MHRGSRPGNQLYDFAQADSHASEPGAHLGLVGNVLLAEHLFECPLFERDELACIMSANTRGEAKAVTDPDRTARPSKVSVMPRYIG